MSVFHLNPLTMLTRKCLQPIAVSHKKWGFTFFKNIHGFKGNSNLLLRKLIAGQNSTCRYAHSFPFQDLISQADLSFNNSKVQQHIDFLLKEFNEAEVKLKDGGQSTKDLNQVIYTLKPIVHLKCERDKLLHQVQELDLFISDLKLEEDKELLIVAQQERETLLSDIHQCEMTILQSLLPERSEDDKDIIVEVSCGVGGQEAMLFTRVIFDMYCKFAAYKNLSCEVIRFDETDLGGLRNAHISINGKNAYKLFKFESGIHRVQRVPKTERSGRVHTSTMTVAVLPQPTEVDVVLNPKDIEMQCKHSSGAGGQNVNKTLTCVRLTHIPTGITAECQMERYQQRNRELAMKSLRAKVYKKKLDEIEREASSSRKYQV